VTTLDWILVCFITWGPLLGFLAGAELANRHDRQMRRATDVRIHKPPDGLGVRETGDRR
jgi:hypothetical protein